MSYINKIKLGNNTYNIGNTIDIENSINNIQQDITNMKNDINSFKSGFRIIDQDIELNSGYNYYHIEKDKYRELYVCILFTGSSQYTIYISSLINPFGTTVYNYAGTEHGCISVYFDGIITITINVITPDVDGQKLEYVYAR